MPKVQILIPVQKKLIVIKQENKQFYQRMAKRPLRIGEILEVQEKNLQK